jgi:hypothetical protein
MTPDGFPGLPRQAAPGIGLPELAVQAAGSQAGPEIRAPVRTAVLSVPAPPARDRPDKGRREPALPASIAERLAGADALLRCNDQPRTSGRITGSATSRAWPMWRRATWNISIPSFNFRRDRSQTGGKQSTPSAVDRAFSPAACRAALFIMLYRGYPLLQLPFQVLHQLLEIDEQLSTWRYRHMSMVHRTIGTRIGTGGSTGKDYLGSALERHHLFREIAALTSFPHRKEKAAATRPGDGKRDWALSQDEEKTIPSFFYCPLRIRWRTFCRFDVRLCPGGKKNLVDKGLWKIIR